MTLTVKSRAESVQASFNTVRVLVNAVDDKVAFFIAEKSISGPYHELIKDLALDIQTLLSVITSQVWEMEKEQGEVVHMLSRRPVEESTGGQAG